MPSWILQSFSGSPFRKDARTKWSFLSRHKSPTKTKRISTDPSERMILASSSKLLKDAFAAAKLDDTNKKKVSNHSVRNTSVGRLLEVDFRPNFVAELSGHKNLKSFDSYHSASLKRQREMSAILSREQCTSAQSEETQVSTSTTTQQNVFTVQQIQPQAIFAGARIDKCEGCTSHSNVFCGDQSKIARLNGNWSRSKQALLTLQLHFWSLSINCWACRKNLAFIHWRSLYKAGLCPLWTGDQWQQKAS